MGVTSLFHNALIHSIVEMTKENEDISIFDFIRLMVSETNWILSPGARDFGPSSVSKIVQRFVQGIHSYPLISEHYGTPKEKKRILYRDCLVKIHETLNREWDVSWYDLLTYLLFIQSNCHHKGNTNSHKLCRNSDSFLDFFYKSKSEFNPWSQWELSRLHYSPVMDYIQETKTAQLRGEWWVKAFEREKENFLMFETLAPTHYLGTRFTTGWVVRGFKPEEGDFLPQGSVLNQLREHYELPLLSGDYGLGCMSVTNKVLDGPNLKDNDKDKDEVCVYFNLGFGIACGIVCMQRFIHAK
tara:strand:+ start:613 stop:1509 length:897 start_codon:yes stop_codon:yes gene_type:complete